MKKLILTSVSFRKSFIYFWWPQIRWNCGHISLKTENNIKIRLHRGNEFICTCVLLSKHAWHINHTSVQVRAWNCIFTKLFNSKSFLNDLLSGHFKNFNQFFWVWVERYMLITFPSIWKFSSHSTLVISWISFEKTQMAPL